MKTIFKRTVSFCIWLWKYVTSNSFLNKVALLALLALMIVGACKAQHRYTPGKRYPAKGIYQPKDTVSIYNRQFEIQSFPYAESKNGQTVYAAKALNSPDGKLVPGRLYVVVESQIGKGKKNN